MLIRTGFVTNSSSTNFIIISREELTEDYLLKKLGFSPTSKIANPANSLVEDIMSSVGQGLRWHDFEEINYDTVKEAFGNESANRFLELHKKGFKSYWGYTSSDDNYFTSFMTTDHFLIDDADFYFNGRNCVW